MITYTLIIVWLGGCYFIGQKTHPKTTETVAEVTEPAVTEAKTEQDITKAKDETHNAIPVTFINHQNVSTEEIPWGFTAGVITLEDGTEAWLLTPGTGLQIEPSDGITLRYSIHPWMKEISDGSSLQISYGENNEALTVHQSWQEYSLPKDAGPISINVLSTENDNGDWVIIQTEE